MLKDATDTFSANLRHSIFKLLGCGTQIFLGNVTQPYCQNLTALCHEWWCPKASIINSNEITVHATVLSKQLDTEISTKLNVFLVVHFLQCISRVSFQGSPVRHYTLLTDNVFSRKQFSLPCSVCWIYNGVSQKMYLTLALDFWSSDYLTVKMYRFTCFSRPLQFIWHFICLLSWPNQ